MSQERNTREAPALERCQTCGASPLDGNGEVSTYTWPMPDGTKADPLTECDACANGGEQLVADDPENYERTKDGHVRRKTPDPHVETRRAAVDRLHAALAQVFTPEVIDGFHPTSGVAVVLPNGYRWHVFIREADPFGVGVPSAVLFSPGLEYVKIDGTIAVILLPGDTEDEVAEMVASLVEASVSEGTPFEDAISAHVLSEMQVHMFNPDDLLKEADGD